MIGKKRYWLVHTLVIVYLIAAFTWWAILLFKKNEEIHMLKTQLIEYNQTAEIQTQKTEISDEYSKQKKMILGEGLVFGLSILFGLILINRAYRSELNTNKKLNSFLLSVTHELKTPIAALKMASSTLQRPDLPDNVKNQLLDTSLEEATRLEDSVNNILAAAQLEQSYAYNKENYDLAELLQQRINRFKKIYPEQKIISDIQAPAHTKIDVEALTKVIDNLTHNAIKYSKESTPINIKLSANAGKHQLSIANEGPHISDKDKKKIWEKFYRTGNEETRESQGTGLGLWIVKSIITAHQGQISVTDNKPTGALFQIKLPQS